jgi:membrane-bound lytic murein transglycosylase B
MLPAVDAEASIVLPDGPEGRTFLVYNNYTVLLKWNRSHHFAVGVCLLADQLQGDR